MPSINPSLCVPFVIPKKTRKNSPLQAHSISQTLHLPTPNCPLTLIIPLSHSFPSPKPPLQPPINLPSLHYTNTPGTREADWLGVPPHSPLSKPPPIQFPILFVNQIMEKGEDGEKHRIYISPGGLQPCSCLPFPFPCPS